MREHLERELKLVPGEGFRLADLGQPQPELDSSSCVLPVEIDVEGVMSRQQKALGFGRVAL